MYLLAIYSARLLPATAALGSLRLPAASFEFADGACQSFAAAYGRRAEREPAGSGGAC